MGRRRTRWAVAIAGLAFGLAGEAMQLAAGVSPERALIDFVVGAAYLLGGLHAGSRDPRNATWLLMAAAGWAWFLGNLAASSLPVVAGLGVALADTDAILLTALILAYPTGRLDDAVHRVVVAAAALGLTGTNVAALITGDFTPSLIVGLVLTFSLAVLVPRRWLLASASLRRTLGPVVLAAVVTLATIAIAIVVRLVDVAPAAESLLLAVRDLAVLAVPLGFVVGSFQLAEDELRLSRARIVETADAERRRLERDLHDGAQQRLVGLSMALRLLRSRLGPDVDPEVAASLDESTAELKAAIADLRDIARGIHPAVLTETGLAGALPALADRAQIPATVIDVPQERLPGPVEVTAYFVVAEALTNVGRHAGDARATISARVERDRLRLEVRDDGVGGAEPERGTGLRGLGDRVAAVGGRLDVESPPGRGTTLVAEIPLAGR